LINDADKDYTATEENNKQKQQQQQQDNGLIFLSFEYLILAIA